MTVAIVDAARPVTGGVDMHLDLDVAAALDTVGGLLAVAEFPTTSAGHRELLGWLSGFGPVARVGVEGTGSYGAGLARFLRAAGVQRLQQSRRCLTMEYLVSMTTHVPDGTPEEAVQDIRAREAAHSRKLAAQGHLLRLWRPPLQPGEWRTLGLFAAADGDRLEEVLASMPLGCGAPMR